MSFSKNIYIYIMGHIIPIPVPSLALGPDFVCAWLLRYVTLWKGRDERTNTLLPNLLRIQNIHW